MGKGDASAPISSLLVSSELSYGNKPKFDGASLLPLFIVLKLLNILDLRFVVHCFYLDLIHELSVIA